MALLESLPPRPLSADELAALNRAEAFDLAVAFEGETPASGLLVATGGWVKALGFDDGWRTVATVDLDDRERGQALQDCESELRAFRET